MTAVEKLNIHNKNRSSINLTSILVIDNDHIINNLLQSNLKKIYTLVEVVENIQEAETLLQRCHFDLIIINISPSDDTTIKWVSSLREKGDEVGLIFMAENAALEMAIDALHVGAVDFILKPFNQEQMMVAVKNFFEHKKVKRENFILRRQIEDIYDSSGIIGDCDAINSVCQVVKRVAPLPSTVLIEGESGTGKELVARAIHNWSNRSGSFVPINCGGMSAELLESELFGHVKGAFTGANQAREGLFSYANHGTLFLDEIGEMPLSMQAHLLRVLEEQTVRAVGSNREIPLDVRIVAATNKDLTQQIKKRVFREDLFYRLNVLSIRTPSLRERTADIPLLAKHFISTLSMQLGIESPSYDENEFLKLQEYNWPGNVRELKNVIERCLLLDTSPVNCVPGLATDNPDKATANIIENKKLEHVEKQHILKVLEDESGNKSSAARILGISRKTLERKVQLWNGD